MADQTYQWRVDLIGPAGTVTGDTWEFTAGNAVVIDDFESYADNAAVTAAWPHNITGDFEYVFAETTTIAQGVKSMRLEYQNQYEPFVTEVTRTFDVAQDWKGINGVSLGLSFRGVKDNAEQPLYVRLEDEAGNQATIAHELTYAVQSEPWRSWEGISLSSFAGVDMATVKKITIGVGGGENASAQAVDDRDAIYIDNIRLIRGGTTTGGKTAAITSSGELSGQNVDRGCHGQAPLDCALSTGPPVPRTQPSKFGRAHPAHQIDMAGEYLE